MWILDAIVVVAIWVVFVLLFWRCHRERHWSHYPLVYAYLVYVVLRSAAIQVLPQDHPLYSIVYWLSGLPGLLFRIGVAWEILRTVFPSGTPLREIANRVLLGTLAILAVTFYFLPNPRLGVFIDVERKVGLMLVCWLAIILLLARFYQRPLSKNIWGMAVGMGLNVSITVANYSAYDLKGSFFIIWRTLGPYSYLAMLLIWLWALWTYTPMPQLQPVSGPLLDAAQAGWQQSWRKVTAAIRKGVGR